MKRILLVLMACFPVIGLMAAEVEPLAGDTIITLERKRIEVKDNGDRMKVRVYEVDEDGDYFKEIDGVTALRPAPESVTLKASKLNITSLTIPLLLEWQPKKRSSEFFLSAGVVGVIKTCSSSKIVYNDASGKKHKEKMDSGMNIRPVTMDFLFQAGWDWIGLYAKYSPIDLFENGKGPKVHPVSIGLQLHL